MGLERERELELPRDQAAVGPGGAERLRLAEGLTIERVAGGQPHAPVVPRRLRVPLVEVVEVVRADAAREGQLERRILLDVLRLRSVEEVGQVHLAALEHGHPRGGLGHALVDQPLDRGHLAPVTLVGLHHQLDARRVADELVGPEAHRILLEAVGAHLLHVLLGDDPARAGRVGPVEGHEVGPRLVEVEAHPVGSGDLDVAHLLLQDLRALGAVEAEPHVLGGERVAVVELESLAQLELVDAPVRAHLPGLGEARGQEIAGHRLHERVVHRGEHPERGQHAHHLGRIEPGRRERHVEGPAHLALGLGLGGRGGETGTDEQGDDQDSGDESAHRS